MLNRLFYKFKNFILLDVTSESESNDFAVLLRALNILTFAYTIISSLYVASFYHYEISVMGIFFIGLSVGSFMLTYVNKTKNAFLIYILNLLCFSTLYSVSIGWKYNFQWNLFIALFVLFYPLFIELSQKIRYSKMIFVLFGVICILTHCFTANRDSSRLYGILFDIFSVFYYFFTFLAIAYAYCTKYNTSEEKLHKYTQQLAVLASCDALTSLKNRRSMGEHLNTLVYEYNKNNTPFSIAIADVDFFKSVNDKYGHDAGDYILKSLSEIFSKTMEGRGTVARWGGEEFLFSFEGLTGTQATSILNNMRSQIEHTTFKFKDFVINITITIGVEDYSPITGLDLTISSSDKKLYDGKQNGRNQVVY